MWLINRVDNKNKKQKYEFHNLRKKNCHLQYKFCILCLLFIMILNVYMITETWYYISNKHNYHYFNQGTDDFNFLVII